MWQFIWTKLSIAASIDENKIAEKCCTLLDGFDRGEFLILPQENHNLWHLSARKYIPNPTN